MTSSIEFEVNEAVTLQALTLWLTGLAATNSQSCSYQGT